MWGGLTVRGRYSPLPLALLTVTLVAGGGCGGATAPTERLVPVSGTITLDGKPLAGATIMFWPDSAKGNQTTSQPYAEADSQGRYQLLLGIGKDKHSGSPLGWYRVIVEAWDLPKGKSSNHPPKLLSPQVYADPKKSPLAVEVIETPAPGAYDLQLKRRS